MKKQIVIEIDEDMYKNILWGVSAGLDSLSDKAIANGTVLPKHGRLKDFDKIEWYGCTSEEDCPYKDRECKDCDRAECWKPQVDKLPTILEAWGNEE